MGKPRILAPACIGTAYYHLISRVVEKHRHFGEREKARLVADLRRHAGFSMIRVVTYCMMSNHFHILVEVPPRPSDAELARIFQDDDALEKHLGLTLGGKALKQFVEMRRMARDHHNEMGLMKMRQNLLLRMWNLSQFMKGFKQDFTIWFNGTREREGTLWESRFKSVLVEPGQALATVAAYIDLNPVRAALVDDPEEYRWCGYAEAMAGNPLALNGLGIIASQCSEAETTPEAILARYRLVLFGDAITVETNEDGSPGQRGFSREKVVEVIKAGGKVPASQLVRCRVRHFVDGVVLGSKSFVDSIFHNLRERFSPRREDGGRPLRAMPKEGRLFALRDLRKSPVG